MDKFKVDIKGLDEQVALGYITKKAHRYIPGLFIYNYTPTAQFDKVWNEYTLIARGLVTDAEGTVIARPLKKFFNFEQYQPEEIPWHLPFEITTKMDGSILIVQKMSDEMRATQDLSDSPNIYATRGSFHSDQAYVGRQIFEENYGSILLDENYTYVFEVIYPQNRIVVEYGEMKDVVLLAMINVQTGEELPLEQAPKGLNVVERHHFDELLKIDPEFLLSLEKRNAEGFVVRFENGMRIKVKFEEYKKLHRVVTGVSSKTVWEYLRDGREIKELLEFTPDEFNEFVRVTQDQLWSNFRAIEADAEAIYLQADKILLRKDQAAFIKNQVSLVGAPYLAGIVFAMLDGKDYSKSLWDMLKPEYRQPFEDRG